MDVSSPDFAPVSRRFATGIAYSVVTCAVAVFVVTALGEGLDTVPLPTFLDASMSIVPGPFRTHILACCFGVVSAGGAFAAALCGRSHRSMGRFAMALLLIGAAASVPVAMAGASSPITQAAFLTQAGTLILAILVGWLAGLRGQIRLHRDCMACVALVLSGAPLSRLALKVPDPWLSPAAGYAAVAWFSWLVPCTAAACLRLAALRNTFARRGLGR